MTAFSDVEHPWSWLHREEIKEIDFILDTVDSPHKFPVTYQ